MKMGHFNFAGPKSHHFPMSGENTIVLTDAHTWKTVGEYTVNDSLAKNTPIEHNTHTETSKVK